MKKTIDSIITFFRLNQKDQQRSRDTMTDKRDEDDSGTLDGLVSRLKEFETGLIIERMSQMEKTMVALCKEMLSLRETVNAQTQMLNYVVMTQEELINAMTAYSTALLTQQRLAEEEESRFGEAITMAIGGAPISRESTAKSQQSSAPTAKATMNTHSSQNQQDGDDEHVTATADSSAKKRWN